MRFAERSLQKNAFAAQEGLQIRQPIIAITQDDSACSFQQERRNFAISFMSRGQKHPRQKTRPTQLRMRAVSHKRFVDQHGPCHNWLDHESEHTKALAQSGRREWGHCPQWTSWDRS